MCAYVACMLLVVVDGLGGGMCLYLYTLVGMMHVDCVWDAILVRSYVCTLRDYCADGTTHVHDYYYY